jgi:TolB-like protein
MKKFLQFFLLAFFVSSGLFSAYGQDEHLKPVVAVLDFNNTTKQFYLDELQKSFPALLKTELSQKRSLFIVERQKIDDILKEQDFVLSDLSEDKNKQTKVGDLAGADYIVTGDISESGKQIRIDVAITKISNGQVVGEKAIAPSKEHIGIMAKMLAQNIVYQLTGEGKRLEKVQLRGAPTGPLLISTVALGAVSVLSFNNKKKYYKDYHDATGLKKIDDAYTKANNWNRAAYAAAGATALVIGAYVAALIKNRNSELEVLADDNSAEPSQWSLQPMLDVNARGSCAGINLSIQF